MEPSNAIDAASHPNPYPYYQRLLAGSDLVFDPTLRCWVASRAAVIEEVMNNEHCVVRPPMEPVPAAIGGTSAGAIFERLIRMNEGCPHAHGKRFISSALADVDLPCLRNRSAQLGLVLGARHTMADGEAITRWMFDLPTYVIASLLGFGDRDLPQVARWTANFVRCLSPLATTEQLSDACVAARALSEAIQGLWAAEGLAQRMLEAGWTDHDTLTANLIGLLSQTHEATAGLIGNCIVALLEQPGIQERLRADLQLVPAFVREVARYDPPVQNTRRFVAKPTTVAGVQVQRGDVIVLLLGATGRDEQVCSQADVFLLERAQRKSMGFGQARHACPGQDIAFAIVSGAVQQLMALPHPLSARTLSWTYARSLNGRLPRFFNIFPKDQP